MRGLVCEHLAPRWRVAVATITEAGQRGVRNGTAGRSGASGSEASPS